MILRIQNPLQTIYKQALVSNLPFISLMAVENGGGGGNNDDDMDNMLAGLTVESYGVLNQIEVLHIWRPPPNIITNRHRSSCFTTAAVPYPSVAIAPSPPTEAGSGKNMENKKTKPEIAEEEKVKKKNTMTKFTDAHKVQMRVFVGGWVGEFGKTLRKPLRSSVRRSGSPHKTSSCGWT